MFHPHDSNRDDLARALSAPADDDIVGSDIDIADYISERIGHKFEYVWPEERWLMKLPSGEWSSDAVKYDLRLAIAQHLRAYAVAKMCNQSKAAKARVLSCRCINDVENILRSQMMRSAADPIYFGAKS